MLTIIVPCYKITPYLSQLKETYCRLPRECEVIFVDDCSPDDSYKQLKDFAEENPNIRVLQTEKNGGPGIARNIGLEASNGDYILFCDSDDVFESSGIPRLLQFIEEHNDLDMAIAPFAIKRGKRVHILDRYETVCHGGEIAKLDIIRRDPNPVAKIFKKEIIVKNQISFPARMTGEDRCFVVRYTVYAKKIYKIGFSFYTYIMRNDSVTHSHKNANWKNPTTFDLLQPIYHQYFPEAEEEMFVQGHLLTQAKNMVAQRCPKKLMKEYFETQNKRYPNWIQNIDLKKETLYRRLIYKAISKNSIFMMRLILKIRILLY